MRILIDTKWIGITTNNFGIGLLAFPWLRIYGGQLKSSASFLDWFFCKPTINNIAGYKFAQLRILWFTMIARVKVKH